MSSKQTKDFKKRKRKGELLSFIDTVTDRKPTFEYKLLMMTVPLNTVTI